jgi:hypothetical protein
MIGKLRSKASNWARKYLTGDSVMVAFGILPDDEDYDDEEDYVLSAILTFL